MIALVIIAILAGASMAGYRQYVRRANRVDATSALLRVSAAQERFYLQNDHYATTDDELRDPPPNGLGIDGSERGLYNLAVQAGADGPAAGYTVTATASSTASQRDDDDCQAFSIDQSGKRSASDAGGGVSAEITARCWR